MLFDMEASNDGTAEDNIERTYGMFCKYCRGQNPAG